MKSRFVFGTFVKYIFCLGLKFVLSYWNRFQIKDVNTKGLVLYKTAAIIIMIDNALQAFQ